MKENPGEGEAIPGTTWGMHCLGHKLEAGTPVKHKADLNHGCGMRNGGERPEERDGQGVAIPFDVG